MCIVPVIVLYLPRGSWRLQVELLVGSVPKKLYRLRHLPHLICPV